MRKEYRSVLWKRFNEIALVALFTAFLALNSGLLISRGFTAVGLMFLPLWIVGLGVSLWHLTATVNGVSIGEKSITLRTMINKREIAKTNVVSVYDTKRGADSWLALHTADGHDFLFSINAFEHKEDLTAALKALCADKYKDEIEQSVRHGRKFGTKRVSLIGVGVALLLALIAMIVIVFVRDAKVVGIGWALMGCAFLLTVLFYFSNGQFAQFTPDGIVVKRLTGTVRISWDEIESVKLTNPYSNYSRQETIEILSKSPRLWLNDSYDDYPLLRDIVTTKVEKEKVFDGRLG